MIDQEQIAEQDVTPYAEAGEELKPGQSRVQVVDVATPQGAKKINNTHTFLFEHHSTADKRVLSGTITVKRRNVGELARAETEVARRNFGIAASEAIAYFNERLVFLKTRIINGPDWAMNLENSDDVHDPLIVQRLAEEVQKFENSFR